MKKFILELGKDFLFVGEEYQVVEYAMNRNMSPTLVSQYTTILPDKQVLQAKLHELYELYEGKDIADKELERKPE
jgi:hypothetical protein